MEIAGRQFSQQRGSTGMNIVLAHFISKFAAIKLSKSSNLFLSFY